MRLRFIRGRYELTRWGRIHAVGDPRINESYRGDSNHILGKNLLGGGQDSYGREYTVTWGVIVRTY